MKNFDNVNTKNTESENGLMWLKREGYSPVQINTKISFQSDVGLSVHESLVWVKRTETTMENFQSKIDEVITVAYITAMLLIALTVI